MQAIETYLRSKDLDGLNFFLVRHFRGYTDQSEFGLLRADQKTSSTMDTENLTLFLEWREPENLVFGGYLGHRWNIRIPFMVITESM